MDRLSKVILEMNLLLTDTPLFEALQTQVTFVFGGPLSWGVSSFVRTAVATPTLESFAANTFFVVLLLQKPLDMKVQPLMLHFTTFEATTLLFWLQICIRRVTLFFTLAQFGNRLEVDSFTGV